MKKYIVIFIGICTLVASCTEKDNKPVFDDKPLLANDLKELKLDDIPTDFTFSRPATIDFIQDTMLVLFDKDGHENIGHLLSVNGRRLGSFGLIGKGHGEVINPRSINVGSDGQTLYIYDWKTSNAVKFKVSDILENKNRPSVIKSPTLPKFDNYRYNKMIRFTDSDFVGWGYDGQFRLINIEGNKVKSVYTDYPPTDESAENNWSIWNNMATYGISPDRKHIAIGTALGVMLEIFEIKNGQIEEKALKTFSKPIYRLFPGTKPACAVATDKTIWGFTSLYVTNKAVWGVLGGKDYADRHTIYEFDFSGNVVNKYRIDGEVVTLAVNLNDVLYLVVLDKKGEQRLKKVDLKKVGGRLG